MARSLGSEGRGHFALAVLLPSMLCTFTDFGLGTSGPRFVAGRRWPVSEILGSHLIAGAMRIVLMACVGLFLILFLREQLFAGVPVELLVLGLGYLVPLTVSAFVLTLLLGLHAAGIYSRLLLLNTAASFAVLTCAWFIFGLTVWTALVLELVAGFGAAALIMYVVVRKSGGVARPNSQYLTEAYKFGLGVYASNVTLFLNGRLVWLLINAHLGPVGVGLYTVAQAASERIYLLADALGTILLPRVAEDPERNSMRLTPVVFRIALVAATAAAIVLALIADPLVRLLFSESFEGAVPILRLLLVAVILSCGWRVLFQDLNARGRSYETALVNAGVAVVGLGIAAILLPTLGLAGAAWAAIVSGALSFFAGIWLFDRYRGDGEGAKALVRLSVREREMIFRLLRGVR